MSSACPPPHCPTPRRVRNGELQQLPLAPESNAVSLDTPCASHTIVFSIVPSLIFDWLGYQFLVKGEAMVLLKLLPKRYAVWAQVDIVDRILLEECQPFAAYLSPNPCFSFCTIRRIILHDSLQATEPPS